MDTHIGMNKAVAVGPLRYNAPLQDWCMTAAELP